MNVKWFLVAMALCPMIALAQLGASGSAQNTGSSQSYQPAVPAPTSYTYNSGGGWPGGYSGGGTAAGSALSGAGAALSGMGQAMSGAGQRNLANSAAAINWTQAQSNAMQNQIQHVNTYWEIRNTGREQQKAERLALHGPPPSAEQIARWNHGRDPKPLGQNQLNPVTGQLTWPSFFAQPTFEEDRNAINELLAKSATYGGLGYPDQTKARETLDEMAGQLKDQIRNISPSDYMASRTFLNSVSFDLTKSELD